MIWSVMKRQSPLMKKHDLSQTKNFVSPAFLHEVHTCDIKDLDVIGSLDSQTLFYHE